MAAVSNHGSQTGALSMVTCLQSAHQKADQLTLD